MATHTTAQIQSEIRRLCAERDICILAHSYQSHVITEVADFVGDSFSLSVKAQKAANKTLVLCGVRFMAETAKILSPDKTVLLAAPQAGCPMAEQMSRDEILAVKRAHPDYAVVAYVNTTAELKTVADVCVTSSSAVKIVRGPCSKENSFHSRLQPRQLCGGTMSREGGPAAAGRLPNSCVGNSGRGRSSQGSPPWREAAGPSRVCPGRGGTG